MEQTKKKVEEKLQATSPYKIIGATAVGVLALQKLYSFATECTLQQRLGNWALLVPAVRKEYAKEYHKNVENGKKSHKKLFAQFGDPITEIPEHGWSIAGIKGLVDKFTRITNEPLAHHIMSGTIYSSSLQGDAFAEDGKPAEIGVPVERKLETPADLQKLSSDLKDLYTYAFKNAYLWNSLHGTEFAIGDFLTYQVVRMCSDMFGGSLDRTMGFVTSGGTESLMTAMRAYRNWGVKNRGHKVGEGVILACESVHAAVMKAGIAYNIRVELFPCEPSGEFPMSTVDAMFNKFGDKVIALVGSAPAYTCGMVDPLPEMAALAKRRGVGMHIDSCLGGFIINHLKPEYSQLLSIPGVTSMSIDTHKNGWAPKGSSVCVTLPILDNTLGEINLAYYSIYTIPGWSGGVYGTPKDAGSQSVVNTLHAFCALLAVGKSGYRKIAVATNKSCQKFAGVIESKPLLQLVGCPPQCNVVAFRLDPACGKGAVYALAHYLDQRGYTMSALKGELLHFCNTGRYAMDKEMIPGFEKALDESIILLHKDIEEVKKGKISFPGAAGLYGQLEAAMEPSKGKQSTAEYMQNWLLGLPGANDAIRAHFMSNFSPWV